MCKKKVAVSDRTKKPLGKTSWYKKYFFYFSADKITLFVLSNVSDSGRISTATSKTSPCITLIILPVQNSPV
jgi:hypothetical protein